MGLFDLFARDVDCPRCGDRGARQGLLGTVKCLNRACRNFNPGLVAEREEARRAEERERERARRAEEMEAAVAAGTARWYRNPRTGETVYKELPASDFDPGEYRIEVSYQNFLGEQKTFHGDWRTLRRRGKHVSLQVEPTGTRIALATDRIQNIADVEDALGRCPTPQEKRLLAHHAKRGTTSDRCEQLRRKYPDWSPRT